LRRVVILFVIALPVSVLARPFRPARHYALMFEAGRTWTYHLTTGTFTFGEHATSSRSTIVVECTVGAVERRRGAVAATITCDHDLELAGTWTATRRGLFHDGSFVIAAHARTIETTVAHATGYVESSLEFGPGGVWSAGHIEADGTHESRTALELDGTEGPTGYLPGAEPPLHVRIMHPRRHPTR
jgi:hypothetical protein